MIRDGYIDLQVNGYAGIDFNQDELTADELSLACHRLRDDGVAGILATIITDSVDAMSGRLRRIARLREQDEHIKAMILGLHIEGPFISPADDFRGAHPKCSIVPADRDVMKRLLDAADGLTRIVTLAPEFDADLAVTRMLSNAGVVVAAGHCDPSLAELDAAIDAGLSMFTHLGNGCPMVIPRHNNVVQRALYRSDKLWITLIADGVHVAFHALSNYLRLSGARAIIVTDAISAAGMGPGRYQLGNWDLEVGDDLAVWSPRRAHLVGSAITMAHAHQNLVSKLGLPPQQIERLLRFSALEALGLKSLTVAGLTRRIDGRDPAQTSQKHIDVSRNRVFSEAPIENGLSKDGAPSGA